MTARYAAIPFSSPLQSSDAIAGESVELSDEIQIVDDVHGDFEPGADQDAALVDEPALGPPSRSALHWHRVKEALRLFHADGLGAPEIRALDWRLVVEAKPPGAPKARAEKSPAVLGEARLGGRDAQGEANKPELDRPRKSEDASLLRPSTVVLGDEEPPRKTTRTPLPSWASLAIVPADPACPCKCRGRWAQSSKEELIDAILRTRASHIPVRLLRENFTKLGLQALLCGALCERGGELLEVEPAGELPPAPGGRSPRMHRF